MANGAEQQLANTRRNHTTGTFQRIDMAAIWGAIPVPNPSLQLHDPAIQFHQSYSQSFSITNVTALHHVARIANGAERMRLKPPWTPTNLPDQSKTSAKSYFKAWPNPSHTSQNNPLRDILL